MWFQQDGAICHTTRANMILLQEIFPGPVISHCGDINWPTKLCNLTQVFWGYAKDPVYVNKPSTLEYLKTNSRQVMAEMPSNICQKVVENYLKRWCTVVNVQTLQWKKNIRKTNIFCVLFTFTFETIKWITRH